MHHPPGRRRPYFEGWYFKLVDRTEQQRFAIIPGVFYGEKPEQDHAFVQLLDGGSAQVTFERYPIEQFHASDQTFDLHIGPNRFQSDRLKVDIPAGKRSLQGELSFENITPWPATLHRFTTYTSANVETLAPGDRHVDWVKFFPRAMQRAFSVRGTQAAAVCPLRDAVR